MKDIRASAVTLTGSAGHGASRHTSRMPLRYSESAFINTCISKAMPSTHVVLQRKQEGGGGQEAHTDALKEELGRGAAGVLQGTEAKSMSYHHACAAAAEPHRLLPGTAAK